MRSERRFGNASPATNRSPDPSSVLQQIIDAHGGLALWNSLDTIEAEISARGLLFSMKHRPALDHVTVSAAAHEPRFLFHEFPSPGLTSELIGNDEVRILGSDGKVLASRLRPRAAFGGLRRLVRWDALDFVYFGGYAMWNYLTAPFLFLCKGFEYEVLEPASDVPPSWVRLLVTFPTMFPPIAGGRYITSMRTGFCDAMIIPQKWSVPGRMRPTCARITGSSAA